MFVISGVDANLIKAGEKTNKVCEIVFACFISGTNM